MRKELPKLRAALTRAIKSKDNQKIIATVNAALARFEVIGYPDQWSEWQRAKDDAEFNIRMNRTGDPAQCLEGMKTTTPPKSKSSTFTIVVKVGKVGTGHRPHRGGGGTHKHKCDRRQGNRAQQNARAVSDY
jgi:hypothetical protein